VGRRSAWRNIGAVLSKALRLTSLASPEIWLFSRTNCHGATSRTPLAAARWICFRLRGIFRSPCRAAIKRAEFPWIFASTWKQAKALASVANCARFTGNYRGFRLFRRLLFGGFGTVRSLVRIQSPRFFGRRPKNRAGERRESIVEKTSVPLSCGLLSPHYSLFPPGKKIEQESGESR
jgi:hypothetical protein